jgi:hypothetical protein
MDILQQGIAAARGGDKAAAFRLLYQAAQDRSTAEQAWLWLSGVVDQDEQRLFCLDNVLRINPQNEPARRGAGMLRQKGIFPAPISGPFGAPSAPAPVPQSAFSDAGLTWQSMSSPPAVTASPQITAQPSAIPQSPAPRPVQPEAQRPVAVTPAIQVPAPAPAGQVQVSAQMAEYIAKELNAGRSPQAVAKSLVDIGIPPEKAAAMIGQTQELMGRAKKVQNKAKGAEGRNQMIGGLILAVIGICATMISYNLANPGGKYTVWGGAIIIGVINIIIGFIRWIAGLFSSK